MREKNLIRGYKVFNSDWTCNGFQFEIGKTFEEDVKPSCYNSGFHFCKEPIDCFKYYEFNPNNRVAEVVALGEIDENEDGSICCTNKIEINNYFSWEDMLYKARVRTWNCGNNNTGYGNTGHDNSGNYNSGSRNSGHNNSGSFNTGNYNSGIGNSGECNFGYHNTGDYNSGNKNSGDYNSGIGNSGSYNSGNFNTGDYNIASRSNGCFNTEEQKIFLFNKHSEWTYKDWLSSEAYRLLGNAPKDYTVWFNKGVMTKEEQKIYSKCKGAVAAVVKADKERQKWWDNLLEETKEKIKSIPNFDAKIFKEVTGIDVTKKTKK